MTYRLRDDAGKSNLESSLPCPATPSGSENPHAETFERLYDGSDDPWGFRSRWYERRKRSLLRAVLPRESYQSAWEIGCSNGELAAALAPSCDRLLATDGNASAVAMARKRLTGFAGATVNQLWVPDQWPEAAFDLIVLSELAYYLDATALSLVCERLIPSLSPGGHFIACHWRPPIAGCVLSGDAVHHLMTCALPWQKLARHVEDDFILEVWSESGGSVAQTEGIR